MARYEPISIEEARHAVLPPRRQVAEQYQSYIRGLLDNGHNAGQLILDDGDHPVTERARLKAAAKAEGVQLYIRRRGPNIVFWLLQEGDDAPALAQAVPGRGGAVSVRRPKTTVRSAD